MHVQTTPIGAQRAAHHHVWPRGSQDANDAVAILGADESPPGPRRRSNAPAGRTPRRGRLSAIAVAL
eukprot:1774544-Alexandrium_andersonii.AAC.1